MQRNSSSMFFLILLAGAAIFILFTSRFLPDVVASHFGASGAANGYMPRALYVQFFLVIIVVVPMIAVFLPALALRNPKARINLPHQEYWLAPERRAETIEFLRRQMARFGSMLVVFLCYVHWLLVRANTEVPPNLPSAWFMGGLVVFLAFAIISTIVLIGRFRNIPR